MIEFQKDITNHAIQSILDGKIIAWFQGALEFGDRALGNRSIIADPRGEEGQAGANADSGR